MTALDWEGCLNVRDLGGLPTEDGRRTRAARVVRADNVRRLTDAGWRSLAEHGVTRIVDLRWPEELAEDPPRDVEIDVVHVSLLGESATADYVDDSTRISPRPTTPTALRLVRTSTSSSATATASARRSPRSPTRLTAPSSSTAWAARTARGCRRARCCALAGVWHRRDRARLRADRREPHVRLGRRGSGPEEERGRRRLSSRRRRTPWRRRYARSSNATATSRRTFAPPGYRRAARAPSGAACRCLSCATSRRATARSARCTASRSRGGGRLRRVARRERRGQDDDAARDLRHRQDERRRPLRRQQGLPAHAGGDGTAGFAHVPEGRGTFTTLSVIDNLRLGAWVQRGVSQRDLARVFEFFPRLYERREQQAGRCRAASSRCLHSGAR